MARSILTAIPSRSRMAPSSADPFRSNFQTAGLAEKIRRSPQTIDSAVTRGVCRRRYLVEPSGVFLPFLLLFTRSTKKAPLPGRLFPILLCRFSKVHPLQPLEQQPREQPDHNPGAHAAYQQHRQIIRNLHRSGPKTGRSNLSHIVQHAARHTHGNR